jgi:hypothetical protein
VPVAILHAAGCEFHATPIMEQNSENKFNFELLLSLKSPIQSIALRLISHGATVP